MTFLIVQMLGLLVVALLLGWLIGRWKLAAMLAERDDQHEIRLRSKFKQIEELKHSINESEFAGPGVDPEVHRMLEDRYYKLKREQQLAASTMFERNQALERAEKVLVERDTELQSLKEKASSAQTLIAKTNDESAAALQRSQNAQKDAERRLQEAQRAHGAALEEAKSAALEAASAKERASFAEQARDVARARAETAERAVAEAQSKAIYREQRLAQVTEQAELEQHQAALRAQEDTSASLEAALSDANRWRAACETANAKVQRTEALLAEATSRAEEGEQRAGELTAARLQLQSVTSDADGAQREAQRLQGELHELEAARSKAERNAEVLKRVYFRMRDRFRDADARAQQFVEVSEELSKQLTKQEDSAADEHTATVSQLQKNNHALDARLQDSQAVVGRLRQAFNQRFVLASKLHAALKAQQHQLTDAQQAIGRYERAEAQLQSKLRDKARSVDEQAAAIEATEAMVATLKTTVNKQQDKLGLCRDSIDELQRFLNADLSQAARVRRERGPAHLARVAANSADNLQRIKGIGWRKESRLRSLGIKRYADLARMTQDDVIWLDQVMGLDGAALRQDWVGQSRKLAIVKRHGPKRAGRVGHTPLSQPIARIAESGSAPDGKAS